jgi:hypothetical protein
MGSLSGFPQTAREWLEANKQNRPQRKGQIDRYADQMKNGDWLTSPDAIAFDKNGRLINGQHRLKAIEQSSTTQKDQLVVWGLEPAARKISDVGAKSTASDMLHIEGFQFPQELGAVLKLVVLWRDDELEKCNQYEVVEKYRIVGAAELCTPRIYDSIKLLRRHKEFMKGSLPRSLPAFAHFIFSAPYPEKADQFVEEAFNKKASRYDWVETEEGFKRAPEVENLERYEEEGKVYPSPAYLLHQKVDEQGVSAYGREKWLAYTIQAMNWYCTKDPHKRLRYRSGDRFPRPQAEMILGS